MGKTQENQRLFDFFKSQRLLQKCQRLSSDYGEFLKKSWNFRKISGKSVFSGENRGKNRKMGYFPKFSPFFGIGGVFLLFRKLRILARFALKFGCFSAMGNVKTFGKKKALWGRSGGLKMKDIKKPPK